MELWICITGARRTSYTIRLRTKLSTLRFNPAQTDRSLFSALVFCCLKGRKEGSKWLTNQI